MDAVETIAVLFILTIPVVVVGFVYSHVLTRPDHLLESVYKWAEQKLPEWLFSPLIGCPLCVSGQLSLWLFPFVVAPSVHLGYNFFLHVYFVAQSIFNVSLLKHFYLKIETENIITDQIKQEIEDPPEVKAPRQLKSKNHGTKNN